MGSPSGSSADQAAKVLRSIRPAEAVAIERKHMALELLADLRRLDQQIAAVSDRTADAVAASGTTVTEVYGIGPILAAVIVGHTGHVGRFPTAGHYARYNATAPIEASSGPEGPPPAQPPREPAPQPRAPHRRGHPDPQRHPRPRLPRPQDRRGQDKKEAIRALKRRISDAVYRQLLADTRR